MNMIEGYTRFLRKFHLIKDNEELDSATKKSILTDDIIYKDNNNYQILVFCLNNFDKDKSGIIPSDLRIDPHSLDTGYSGYFNTSFHSENEKQEDYLEINYMQASVIILIDYSGQKCLYSVH